MSQTALQQVRAHSLGDLELMNLLEKEHQKGSGREGWSYSPVSLLSPDDGLQS